LSDEPDEQKREPLLSLSPLKRGVGAGGLVLLAVAHVLWPHIAFDGVFLGLLAFAAFVALFDIQSIEWQGIRAQRRQIKQAHEALKGAPKPTALTAPPAPAPAEMTFQGHAPIVTVHTPPFDLNPPTDRAARLLWGAEQIKIELVVLLGNSSRLPRVAPWSDYAISELAPIALYAKVITPELSDAIRTVVTIRKSAVFGHLTDPGSELAMEVLEALREIPREYIRVRRQHITLFRDRSLSTPFAQTPGVLLSHIGTEGGRVTSVNVYPRETEYAAGRFVSWEWNLERAFKEEAWYADPQSQEPKLAWSSSTTFVGREYPQQWGLEYRLPRPDAGLEER
jgi:hypothetical protein